MNDSTCRTDFIGSLIFHAALIGVLFAAGSAAPRPITERTELPEEKALVENSAKSADEEAADATAAKAQPESAASPAQETAPASGEPARTAKATSKALVGAEAKQSVAMAIPEDAPASVKSEIAAALTSAIEAAMVAAPDASRAQMELAAAENVAGQLRAEVSDAFGASAAKDFSRRAFDSALRNLETSVAAELGPKARDMIAAAGAEMAADDSAAAPKRGAEIAIHDKETFQKTLDAEAKRVMAEIAPGLLAETAAGIVKGKLNEQKVSEDEAAMKQLRENVVKGVVENAAGRGFNTGAAWKPSNELILPGTRKNKLDEPLTAKLAEVAEKQAAMIREALPRLAAEAAKAAKWNESFNVSEETKSKITTLHRLETHMANLKAGRGGAADSSLASSLAALLKDAGGGTGSDGNATAYQTLDGHGGSGRNFKEDEYQRLLARLTGRPVGAGAEADLHRVAGEPVNTAAQAASSAAPERIVSLVEPTVAAPAADEPIAPPPFPSATNTAAPYAAQRPTVDGDLSDWNLKAPRAEVRLLENNTTLASGPDVFLQWRAEGLYFAYRLADTGGVQISSGAPYHGDCIELFVDPANSRAPRIRDSNSARQFFFMPFGYKGDPTRTFEKSGAVQPTGKDLATLNRDRTVSFCTAKPEAGGYAVEGFLSIQAMQRRLAPGVYLGFDVSVSPDFDFKNQMQWAAAKSLGNWDRPSTWGDLLLLGTNARATFRGANGTERRVAVAGESLILEVADADMNLDAAARETVAVKLARADGAGAQVLLLTETGADTGIFQGPALLQSGAADRAGAIAVSGGDAVVLTYIDTVNASGARNKPATARLEIGWPVMRFGTHAAR